MTKELRKLAEAATQGEWKWDGNVCDYDPYNESPWLADGKDSYPPILGGQIECANPENAAYIAAANPAAILELLDRLEKAEKDAARYRWLRNGPLVDGEICEELYVAVDSPAWPRKWALVGNDLDKAVDAMEASK